MKKDAMADILDGFILRINAIHAEQANATAAELERMRTYYHRTAWLAACSLVATVVMAVTR